MVIHTLFRTGDILRTVALLLYMVVRSLSLSLIAIVKYLIVYNAIS